jgi:hypothetical protein
MDYHPSVYAHTFGGGVLLIAIVYLALHSSKIISRDPYQILVLILLFSMAISMHGVSHVALESVYKYNPLSLLTMLG